jgi:thiamine phosphate synthase YjbQ (UPF0047 family)
MKVLSLNTGGRTAFVNITSLVQDAVGGLGLRDGSVTVFVPHTTAGLTANDAAVPNR